MRAKEIAQSFRYSRSQHAVYLVLFLYPESITSNISIEASSPNINLLPYYSTYRPWSPQSHPCMVRLAKAVEDWQFSPGGLLNVAIWDDFHIFHNPTWLQL